MADDEGRRADATTTINQTTESGEHPIMNYTAVTTHQSMAEAFLDELIHLSQKIMPNHKLTIMDLFSICKVALEQRAPGVIILEGRHIRERINEQLSRADRYDEVFSVLVIRLKGPDNSNDYESIVDALCERMRKTDLMFLFKARVVLILPHTDKEACSKLNDRILGLLSEAINPHINVVFNALTYPDVDIPNDTYVLDWVEDQLRG
jgi:hypothetical protein